MTDDLRTDVPHPARVYDYLLGGTNNFPADRAAAEAGMRANPAGRTPPRENRAFLGRAVRYLAREAGIRQFLDIGSGIPTSPNVHELAQAEAPDARIVYVDNDPIVLAQSRALLTGGTEYLQADLRDVGPIMGSVLDLDRPVALLLIAIMHFVPDGDDPYGIAARLLDALPAGSYLALTHLTGDFDPDAWEAVAAIYRRTGVHMRVRSRAEIERFFDGLDLVDPGLVVLPDWRPDGDRPRPRDVDVAVYGAVARKV